MASDFGNGGGKRGGAAAKARDGQRSDVLRASRAYLDAGISFIPVKRDGTKAPDLGSWDPCKERLPTEAERLGWFDRPDPPGIATVGGRVSGNLEQLDFDVGANAIFPAWCELVEAECPGLVARLSVVRTPREPAGYHARYRCQAVEIPGNTKLAVEPYTDPKDGKRKRRTLIETRGEGGYALAPGSPPECHENGRPYAHHSGPPVGQVATVTAAEREVLLRCARSFDQDQAGERNTAGQKGDDLRPGDDFNRRGPDWPDLLEPHGWTCVRTAGPRRYWRRPGKEGPGWSATTGVCTGKDGAELFCCFSENADPFRGAGGGRPCTSYSKFRVYALLNHGADFKAAAKALAVEGYGERHRHNGQAGPAPEQAPATGGKPQTAYQIILEHFRRTYAPTFKRGAVLYAGALGREVKAHEALLGPPAELLDLLAGAADAPRDKHGVDAQALPKFFATWSRSAWVDLLGPLPEEDACVEIIDQAQEEFRANLKAAMHTLVSMGSREHAGGHSEVTDVERRSLIDWCCRFAKEGRWASIRGHVLWVRLEPWEKVERLAVALRVELFHQIHFRPFGRMTQNRFGRLAALYGVGLDKENSKVCGVRCTILTPEFIYELLATPNDL
jgi:putative DNA primase/helicase